MNPTWTWKTLPIQGARLVKLELAGNGKDSAVSIDAVGARSVTFELSGASMRITCASEVTIETSGPDDAHICIRIAPRPGQTVVLTRAAVEFTGSDEDEEWEKDLARYHGSERGPWEIGDCVWACDFRLAAPDPATGATDPADE